jgi:hypothetical protein
MHTLALFLVKYYNKLTQRYCFLGIIEGFRVDEGLYLKDNKSKK